MINRLAILFPVSTEINVAIQNVIRLFAGIPFFCGQILQILFGGENHMVLILLQQGFKQLSNNAICK